MVILTKSLKNISVNKKTSILEAIKLLEKTRHKIILVTNNQKLLGIITDGDIRKSLLHNFKFQEKVEKIMNKKPKVVVNTYNHYLKAKK